MSDLPLIRSHERIDYKRCPKKWYWKWRLGLTPKAKSFGATDLGTWMHEALAQRYTNERRASLYHWFNAIAGEALRQARINEVPEHLFVEGQQLAQLGLAMAAAYDRHYGDDPDVRVIDAEIPIEFEITDDNGNPIAMHKLKPDLLYADQNDDVWLMEHKTAKSITSLEHLVIDDQARPYIAMSEIALRKLGLIRPDQQFKGVMYNYLRKALPDEREQNAEGKFLNKNGTVSKKQPAPVFVRHPVTLSSRAKVIALRRLQLEARILTAMRQELINKTINPAHLPKTPHKSCPRFCDYFTMCVVEEQGGDITEMRRNMFVRQNPYEYAEESADEPLTFEMG